MRLTNLHLNGVQCYNARFGDFIAKSIALDILLFLTDWCGRMKRVERSNVVQRNTATMLSCSLKNVLVTKHSFQLNMVTVFSKFVEVNK